MTGTLSQETLEKDLSVSVNVSYSGASFGTDAAAAYVAHSRDTGLSATIRFGGAITDQSVTFDVDPIASIRPTTQIIVDAADWSGFRKSCGNRFVHTIKKGGALYLTFKIYFETAEAMNTVTTNGKVAYGDLTVGGSFYKSVTANKLKVSFSMAGYQIGGNTGELSKMLGGSSGAYNILHCRGDVADNTCEKLLQQFIDYAGTFESSVAGAKDAAGNRIPSPLADFDYVFSEYFQYAIPNPLPEILTPEVRDARFDLSQRLLAVQQQIAIAESIEALYRTKTDPARATEQRALIDGYLTYNYQTLANALDQCWHFPQECMVKYTNTLAILLPIDSATAAYLQYPEYFPSGGFSANPKPSIGLPGSYLWEAEFSKGNGDYCQVTIKLDKTVNYAEACGKSLKWKCQATAFGRCIAGFWAYETDYCNRTRIDSVIVPKPIVAFQSYTPRFQPSFPVMSVPYANETYTNTGLCSVSYENYLDGIPQGMNPYWAGKL